jgi:leucyl aminopeptidase
MFKAKSVKTQLNQIQENILASLNAPEDHALSVDIKILDLTAFLYEIRQVSPNILNPNKLKLAHMMADKQKQILLDYCKEKAISKEKINQFLKVLGI